MVLSPVEAVEAQNEVVVASARFAEDETAVAAVAVVSLARRVVIANQSHLHLAVTAYLYKTMTSTAGT